MPNLKPGDIICATNILDFDLHFPRAAIVIVHKQEKGIVGLNLTGRPLTGLVPLHKGGPCQDLDATFFLHKNADTPQAGPHRIGDSGYSVTTLKNQDQIDASLTSVLLHTMPARSMMLAGHAAWAAGQLEDEVKGGWWKPTRLTLDDVMRFPPERRWHAAANNRIVSLSPPLGMPALK